MFLLERLCSCIEVHFQHKNTPNNDALLLIAALSR